MVRMEKEKKKYAKSWTTTANKSEEKITLKFMVSFIVWKIWAHTHTRARRRTQKTDNVDEVVGAY